MRRSDSAGATPEHADLDTLDIELQVGHVPVPDWRVGHDQPGLDRTVQIQAVARVLSRGKPGGADDRLGSGDTPGDETQGRTGGPRCIPVSHSRRHGAKARSAAWMVARMVLSIASVGIPVPPSTA